MIQQNLNGAQRLSGKKKISKGHILYNSKRQNHEMQNRLMVAKEKVWWEEGGVCVTIKQHEGDLGGDGTVLYVDCGDGY